MPSPQKVVPPLERFWLGHSITWLYSNRTTG